MTAVTAYHRPNPGSRNHPCGGTLDLRTTHRRSYQERRFFKQQLSKGRIKKRVKLLTQIEGGFRNKGVLIIPGNNRMTQNQTREKPVNE